MKSVYLPSVVLDLWHILQAPVGQGSFINMNLLHVREKKWQDKDSQAPCTLSWLLFTAEGSLHQFNIDILKGTKPSG